MSDELVCTESGEDVILPVLTEWRKQQERAVARGEAHAPRHSGASRADMIPQEYIALTAAELDARIAAAKQQLGDRVVILGHHYQRDEIIKFADARGDSLKLAQFAATKSLAEYIVFCGVHFMAESADILSGPQQKVILPNPAAGCSMADMANIAEVEHCWETLGSFGALDLWPAQDGSSKQLAGIIPITYINSAAALKAFCGQNGGAVCTSSNAKKILSWAFEQGRRVLFFPDEHLGRNTALSMGILPNEIIEWDQRKDFGGLPDDVDFSAIRVILWKGFCSTHQRFTPEQIAEAREKYPNVQVIVHPECPHYVVEKADAYGSTEFIINKVNQGKPGDVFAIGTEVNMVRRMAEEHPDMTIFSLDPIVCPCSTMYRIHPAYLCWTLESLVAGKVINQVTVPKEIAELAKLALDRMLTIK